MNKYTFSHNGINYERVTKTAARKAYMAGSNVYVQACNLRPFSMWTYPAVFNRKQAEEFAIDEIGIRNYFDTSVNSFEFYNCINSETGKYAAFYMED